MCLCEENDARNATQTDDKDVKNPRNSGDLDPRHKSNFCAGVKAPWIARKRGRTCESRADFHKAEILALQKFGLTFLFGFGDNKCSRHFAVMDVGVALPP